MAEERVGGGRDGDGRGGQEGMVGGERDNDNG